MKYIAYVPSKHLTKIFDDIYQAKEWVEKNTYPLNIKKEKSYIAEIIYETEIYNDFQTNPLEKWSSDPGGNWYLKYSLNKLDNDNTKKIEKAINILKKVIE